MTLREFTRDDEFVSVAFLLSALHITTGLIQLDSSLLGLRLKSVSGLHALSCESSPGSFDECRLSTGGRQPQTKPVDLGCESAENWQLSPTSAIAIVIITQRVS